MVNTRYSNIHLNFLKRNVLARHNNYHVITNPDNKIIKVLEECTT